MVGSVDLRKDRTGSLSASKAQLLQLLLAKQARSERPIEPSPRESGEASRFPASSAQQSLWFIDQFEGGGSAYNIAIAMEFRGALDRAALQWALDELVQRHEPLRTVFRDVDGQPTQEIHAHAKFALSVVDLSERRGQQRLVEIERHKSDEAQARFDLRHGPVIRGRLLRVQPQEHVLLITMHHIVSDGWSIEILMREFAQLYGAYRHGNQLPSLRIQYADYARWQRRWHASEVSARQLKYWRARLEGATFSLDLPTDRPRPAVRRFRGQSVDLVLDEALTAQLKALARRQGVTLFMILSAGWAILLSRFSGQDDLLIGTPAANRRRDELESLVGLFVNTLVLRFGVSGNARLSEFLGHVKDVTVGAFDHQDMPFEQLVEAIRPERSANRHPIFQTMVAVRSVQTREWTWPGLAATLHEIDNEAAKFDLLLSLEERGKDVAGSVQYDADLFDKETLLRWLGCFTTLLRGMAEGENSRVGDLPILDERERQTVLRRFSESLRPQAPGKLIHELFEAQVERGPDIPAVVYEGRALTYEELNGRANQVARLLHQAGIDAEQVVGLCVERSLDIIVGLLAILKAGGAYVPLDPHSPAERLASMLEDAAPRVVLTQRSLQSILPQTGARLIALDDASNAIERQAVENLTGTIGGPRADGLAYVIYTSGSTGKPKGVAIEHSGVVNLWHGLERLYDSCPGIQRVGLNASLNFDASVQQLVQLLSGRTLHVVPQDVRMDGSILLSYLREHRIDAIDCTPSQLKSWIAAGLLDGNAGPLKLVLVGGEAIDTELWGKLSRCANITFYNMYGPTECTVDCIVARLNGDTTAPHIGRPMDNRCVYILDEHRHPVPIGVKGELYVGGLGVARGYLNKPEMTQARFIRDPFASDPRMRLYKSGDVGRWRADGTIEYLGRNDDQVKIRGYRIELGEIEAQLLLHPQVQEGVVVVREDVPGDKRLVAYFATKLSPGPSVEELRTHLRQKLPDYMVPMAFVRMGAFQLTLSGKVNRKVLPAPDLTAYTRRPYEAPEGEAEQQLAAIWRQLLQVEQVGRDDSFFDLGGHSLQVLRALFEMNQALGATLKVADVYQSPTIRQLAARIAGVASAVEYVDLAREAVLPPQLLAGPAPVSARTNAILLTGATGFVGRFLLSQLLRDTDATLYCLVRAASQQDAATRLKATLSRWDLWRDDFERRVVVIAGDARLSRLGMDEQTFLMLQDAVDEIYHCATSMNHLETYEMAKSASVGAAVELVRLATGAKTKPIHYISSISIFSPRGYEPGRSVNEQSPIDHERHLASEGYVASKWVSEKIFMTARERGVPCNIFRLGLVWGDAQHGRYDELQREYRMLKSSLLAGCGIADYRYEMSPTPVDFVSRAIVFLATRHRHDSGTFHICPSGEMADGVYEAIGDLADRSLQLLPLYDWICEVKRLHHQGRSLPVVPLVEFAFSMDRTAFDRYQLGLQHASVQMDCSSTLQELRTAGIELPRLDRDLIRTCVQSMLTRDGDLSEIAECGDVLPPSRRRA
ncbi:non-ribosomal peptide synthetase [Steroidobacter agaridevorans]|uniref:non-ribosomal peptide synthetase n=1 Tax=Steroidobacter agaridevorans TaxID=2695856 RepID=UPI0013799F90|nr:non-ribosomal peptide synthetase [Steroidobacter agaridevorans]